MNRFTLQQLLPVTLLLGVMAFELQAQEYEYRPWNYPPPPYVAAPAQYNMPPGPQGWQQQYRFPGQQVQQARFTPPRIEATISDSKAFEQQSLVYKIRVIGNGNLKTVTPQLPQIESVVLRQLGEAETESRGAGTYTEFITEYRYLLMPLAAGLVNIPPAQVSGIRTAPGGADGPAYEATTRQALTLNVQPAAEGVHPWLPLYKLKIDVELDDTETFVTGSPLKLEVRITADGASGMQIASIASQLASDDYRVYPGKSTTGGEISSDGSVLQGSRVERFTLVPLYGGWVQIQPLKINWWNVRLNRPEVAVSAMRSLHVTGPARPGTADGAEGTGFRLNSAWMFLWIPLLGVMLFMVYFWARAFFGTGEIALLSKTRNRLKPLLGKLYEPLAAFTARISPRRYFHRLRAWTGRRLPVSWKLWFCLRAVAAEDDPAEWGQALQILAAKHLGVRPNAHYKHLGKSIVAFHPSADAEQVDRLMSALDRAVYGDKPIESFEHWKDDFREQIKPSLFWLLFRRPVAWQAREKFPRLNPH